MPASAGNLPDISLQNPCYVDENTKVRGRENIDKPKGDFRKIEITESRTNQQNNSIGFYGFVESKAKEKTDDYIAERAAVSFTTVFPVTKEVSFEADERNIRNWLAKQLASGTKISTARRYLGKLHSIYREYAGKTPEGEALFKSLRNALQNQSLAPDFPQYTALPFIKAIPSRLGSLSSGEIVNARILFFLLCSGQFNMKAAVEARLSDTFPDVEQVTSIVDSLKDPKRKYLFPLHQGKERTPKIAADLSTALATLLRIVGYSNIDIVTSDMLKGWWIETALSRSIKLETIRALIPDIPATHQWLSLIKPVEVSDSAKLDALKTVATALNPMSPRWYVLCLRGRLTPKDIEACIKEDCPVLGKFVKFFYPTQIKYKQVGKKKVKEEIPYIPHILFFKTMPDKVVPLMNTIGHLAWCYKTMNRPDAPYSVISWEAMTAFQKFIGVFDEDTKLEFVKNDNLVKGTRVRITGGPNVGCEGEIIKEDKQSSDPTLRTFILRIANNVTVKWHAHVEEEYLEVIEDKTANHKNKIS